MTTDAVRDFWNAQSCGEVYAVGENALDQQARTRYQLEPFIRDFARFAEARGKDVLEIGVGMGADHLEWAKAMPRRLVGVDLTPRAVEITTQRLRALNYRHDVRVADAEALPFPDHSFDIVYSWGVLHHSPDTVKAIQEARRVCKPDGVVRIMVYHTYSLVGLLLWVRYALLRGRPLTRLSTLYARHLESPGTKAYTRSEARELFHGWRTVRTSVELSPGDLLTGAAGQRHQGPVLSILRRVWPRWLIRRAFQRFGLFLCVEARLHGPPR